MFILTYWGEAMLRCGFGSALRFGLLLAGLAAGAATAGAPGADPAPPAVPAFYGAEEPDPRRWYHVVEPGDGEAREITRRVYARIAKASGARRDADRLDTVIAYGPGHWTYEWEQEATALLRRAESAEAAGRAGAAQRDYLEAARLFATGSSPHLRSDPHAMAALEKARSAYRAAARHIPGAFRPLRIPHEGETFEAYLHLPPGAGPFPVVVASNGSDVVKEQTGSQLRQELAQRGIAVLLIDLPGVGGSGGYTLTPQSDRLHVAAIRFVRREAGIDPRRVGAMGVSFGGNAMARLFLRDDLADLNLSGVVAACGPLHSSFVAPPEAYDQLPPLTLDGVRDRVALTGATTAALAARLRDFSIKARPSSASQNKIATPLLILATNADPVSPLEDLPLLTERAMSVKTIVSQDAGHCPDRLVSLPIAAAWFQQRFGASAE